MNLFDLSISEVFTKRKTRQISAVELVKEAYASIHRYNKITNACITIRDESDAVKDAKKSEPLDSLFKN